MSDQKSQKSTQKNTQNTYWTQKSKKSKFTQKSTQKTEVTQRSTQIGKIQYKFYNNKKSTKKSTIFLNFLKLCY